MRILVGLGNPGSEYESTRHNFGFALLDLLARQESLTFKKSNFKALLCETNSLSSEKIILVKPVTYMNLSGQAVRAIVDFYKLGLEDVLIAYDELDLPLGRLRFNRDGSAGGHNGIASVIEHLGSKDFHRLRLGISRPKGRQQPRDYVLAPFGKTETKVVDEILEVASQGVRAYFKSGIETAMNQFNNINLTP